MVAPSRIGAGNLVSWATDVWIASRATRREIPYQMSLWETSIYPDLFVQGDEISHA